MENFFVVLLSIVTIVFFIGTYRAFTVSNKAVELIDKYANDKNNPMLIEEIYNFISKDLLLNRILENNQAKIGDISKLHAKLMKWGDFRKYNRYVPITSFFNVTTLDYLLKHKSDDAKSLTQKMMNHFHF